MEKELDLLDKNFNLDNLKSVGIEPIKVLGKAMIDATGTADHPIVCTMLYEKITELDAKIDQLIAKK